MQDLKELNEVIAAIKEEIRQGADALTTSRSVYEFKKTFLDNKQGRIGLLMKEMRNVPNDQKAEFGKTINGAKEWANQFFDELDQKLKEKEQQQRYESEKIDISMPPVKIRYGNLHPVTTVRNQLTDIFASMGFEVYEGTEIETDYYNFTALNSSGPSGTRYAGYLLPVSGVFTPYPDLCRTGSCHGSKEAADQGCFPGEGIPFR